MEKAEQMVSGLEELADRSYLLGLESDPVFWVEQYSADFPTAWPCAWSRRSVRRIMNMAGSVLRLHFDGFIVNYVMWSTRDCTEKKISGALMMFRLNFQ